MLPQISTDSGFEHGAVEGFGTFQNTMLPSHSMETNDGNSEEAFTC